MRLIDADALHEEMCERMTRFRALGKDRVVQNYDFASTVVGDAPTVDAVPVVRCGECKCYVPGSGCEPTCSKTAGMLYPDDNDFCSRGERRETDG